MLKSLVLGAARVVGVAGFADAANAAEGCGPRWWRGPGGFLSSNGGQSRVPARLAARPTAAALLAEPTMPTNSQLVMPVGQNKAMQQDGPAKVREADVAIPDWTRFKPWSDTPRRLFEDNAWQDRNAITRLLQLQTALDGVVSADVLGDIEAGLAKAGMSIRLNPYIVSLIDWSRVETDPIRRQFLPMHSEQEDDHPALRIDSLEEQAHSPVPGLVHRYPDKVLFLATSVCPVYCQYCTRSYAVGQSTQLIEKNHVMSAQNWASALDYIRSHSQIEDVVVSGGDLARLKPAHVRALGNSLLEIEHIRRIRFATKVLSVQPMKILTDHDWFNAVVEVVERGRSMFKDVCIHTHFNHPNEVTPLVEAAMRRVHEKGIFVRNQTVLLRGVNDNSVTLRTLVKKLGRINIHPYYVYLCDMVKATEHFRAPLKTAQRLEKEVRGSTAGFNTPLFIIDTASGKRDVHSAEFHDGKYGIAGFTSPVVAPGRMRYYFDPIRSLSDAAAREWAAPDAHETILAGVQRTARRLPSIR